MCSSSSILRATNWHCVKIWGRRLWQKFTARAPAASLVLTWLILHTRFGDQYGPVVNVTIVLMSHNTAHSLASWRNILSLDLRSWHRLNRTIIDGRGFCRGWSHNNSRKTPVSNIILRTKRSIFIPTFTKFAIFSFAAKSLTIVIVSVREWFCESVTTQLQYKYLWYR